MALSKAVQGSNHTAQEITWQEETSLDAVGLTNATITAKMRPRLDGDIRAVTGTLAVTDATAGIFTWTYGTTDIETAGEFDVQFFATFPDATKEKNFIERFIVKEALDV